MKGAPMRVHPMRQGTYTTSSGYGPRWGTHHNGIDFAAPIGTPIYAAADGTVIQGKDRPQGSVSGFGSWIWLDCQNSVGKDFIYGHVHHPGILVKRGDRVKAGQQIGVVGNEGQSTGPHLHFEVWGSPGRLGGKHEDPQAYLDRNKEGETSVETVLDYSAKPISATAIKAAGHAGAVRYISPPRESWMKGKPASKQESSDFEAAGIDMAFVWQYGGAASPDAMRGARGGELDARAADKQLAAIGRAGYPVFFAVDFDITLEQWNTTAVKYFQACCKVLGRDRVGIYGHSRVIAWAVEDGVIADLGGGKALGWQTRSWSNGKRAPEAVLYQGTHNVAGPEGVQVDVNEVLYEFWGQRAIGVKPGGKEEPAVVVKPTAQYKCDNDMLTWRDNGIIRAARRAICLHTDESAYNYSTGKIRNSAWTADQLAAYNRRRDISGGSYHLGIDRAGRTTRQNDDAYGTWSVGSAGNNQMYHICLTGTAYQTREQWLSLGAKQLDKLAEVLAHYCLLYDIPAVRVNPADLKAGKRGICGHWDCSKFYGGSTHWDPGGYDGSTGVPKTAGGFPWDVVVSKTQKIVQGKPVKDEGIKPGGDVKKNEEVGNVGQSLDDVVQSMVAGSDFRDTRGNFILHADRNSFLAMKNTETLIGLVQRLDGRLSAVEAHLGSLEKKDSQQDI